MNVFNNRELSIIIWLFLFLIVITFNRNIRISIREVVIVLLSRQILTTIALMALYVTFIIFLLYQVDLWKWDQVKNSIVWFFSVAFISLFGIENINKNPNYFKDEIKKNLELIVVMQFVLSVYTFSLGVELIFVPVMIFLTLLIAVSSQKEEYKIALTFFNKILEIIGIGIIVFTIYKLFTDFSEMYQQKTLYDFMTPVLLSILFLPFLYVLSVFMLYESVFVRLPIFVSNPEVIKYAKFASLRRFKLNTSLLNRWFDLLTHRRPDNKADIDASINDINIILEREKNPGNVDREDGWSPYEAMVFLKDSGIETGYYKELYDNEWFASSPLKNLGENFLSNNIAYYIDGTEDAAKKLKVKLNINDLDSEAEDINYFIIIIEVLFKKALQLEFPASFKKAVINKDVFNKQIAESKNCAFEINKNLNNSGYDMKFSIESI